MPIRRISTNPLRRTDAVSPNVVADIAIVRPDRRDRRLLLAFAPKPLLQRGVTVGAANGLNDE